MFRVIRFISGMELLTFAPGFSKLFGTQGASSSGSLLNLLSPRICFTRVVIMIYLFEEIHHEDRTTNLML